MVENSKENLSFQAEVSKLLDLVAISLYSEREIFLRELISNSADACEKLRYQSLSKKNLLKNDKDLKINIRVSKKKKIIEIEDNGIGMTKQELIDNLGTIARSGTSKFIEAMKNKKKDDISAIGQFGVGFYSSYMVSDRVDVLSKDAENNETNIWSSNGKENYSIDLLQETHDNFFRSLESDIRETGHGDVTVNKKMKDYLNKFYDILSKIHNWDNLIISEKSDVIKNVLNINTSIDELIKYFDLFIIT